MFAIIIIIAIICICVVIITATKQTKAAGPLSPPSDRRRRQ